MWIPVPKLNFFTVWNILAKMHVINFFYIRMHCAALQLHKVLNFFEKRIFRMAELLQLQHLFFLDREKS